MIVVLFKLILITGILVLGFKIGTSEGMVWEKLGEFAKRKIDEGYKIFNLIFCEWCMPSLFSFVGFAFAFGLGIIPFEWNTKYVFMYPLCVAGTSFLTGMSWTFYLTLSQFKSYIKFLNDENGAA